MGVLTVGHEETFRKAMREIVNAAPGFESAVEAGSAEEALESALPLRPQLALVAAEMPAIDGVETTRRLKDAVPKTVVILVYATGEPDATASSSAGAAVAVRQADLSPTSLRALWEDHEPPST